RIGALRERQEAEEVAQRGRQDGDRPRLEMAGVASEVVLETGRPQAAEVRWGVSELPLQERARVAHAVDASVLGQPARLAEEVVVLGQEGVVRRWRRQQPGRVLLG